RDLPDLPFPYTTLFRSGWLALVAVILFSGSVAQMRLLADDESGAKPAPAPKAEAEKKMKAYEDAVRQADVAKEKARAQMEKAQQDRKSTRLNSSHRTSS